MTSKQWIAGLASIAAMAGVLWSMPAAADSSAAVRYAHDKFPAHLRQTGSCPNPDDCKGPDGDHDSDEDPVGAPEPGTLALLALGLGGIGFGRSRKRTRS